VSFADCYCSGAANSTETRTEYRNTLKSVRLGASRASDLKDSTPQYGGRLLRCGISIWPMSARGRYCCKSPKLPGDNFPAIRRSDRRPPICVASITLRRSPVSLSSGDEVPHIFTRKSRLQPGEFLISSAKRLLQQYLHEAAVRKCPLLRRLWGLSGHRSASSICEYTPQLSRSKKGDDFPSPLEKYLGEVRLKRFGIGRLTAEADIAVGTNHIQTCTPSSIAVV
jgi:hypothetical protein